MRNRYRLLASITFVLSALLQAPPLFADEPAVDDDVARQARVAFKQGAELVEQSEWSPALAAFEKSDTLRPHALTEYNIGVCQRFLGRYTLALRTMRRALTRSQSTGEMPSLFVEQARTYIAEMDAKLAHLTIELKPATAEVAIDGRVLERTEERPDLFVAGVAEARSGGSVGLERFEVLVDPRAVVLTFSSPGYDTIEIRREAKPGAREVVPVSMTEQPAQIRIASDVPLSIVRVDGVDVGVAPVTVSRPPGPHLIAILKDGYVPYSSKVALRPGQMVPLDARLEVERVPLTKRWWFWTGAAGAVALAAVGTYFLVRPEPTRPDPESGGLRWIAEVK